MFTWTNCEFSQNTRIVWLSAILYSCDCPFWAQDFWILAPDGTFLLELLFLGTSKFMVKRVKVEKAKSDKSSCKKCQKKIGFDELRAGVDCWMAGRTVTAWLHMKCMSQCFKFDRCKGRGKCKMSGDTMERGDARLELAKEYTGIFFKLNHSHAALADFLKEKVMDPKSIKGYSMLSADEKSQLWKSKSKSKWKGKTWFIHFRKPLQVCLRPFSQFEGREVQGCAGKGMEKKWSCVRRMNIMNLGCLVWWKRPTICFGKKVYC